MQERTGSGQHGRSGGRQWNRRQESMIARQAELIQSIATLDRTTDLEKRKLPSDAQLPAMQDALRHSDTLIVHGPPGSGKSISIGAETHRICTEQLGRDARVAMLQPRRDAAQGVAIATAVRYKRYFKRGFPNDVTYTTSEFSAQGVDRNRQQLNIQTYGVLLNQMRKDPLLQQYDAVIFDEVHEESLDMFLAMGLAKKANELRAAQSLPLLKIVLSSATLKLEKYQQYIGCNDETTIAVEGSLFPVKKVFANENELYAPEERSDKKRRRDYTEVAANKVAKLIQTTDTGDILVFMPGLRDIENTMRYIQYHRLGSHIELLRLHGSDEVKHRERILKGKDSNDRRRRIIVSTNMAETSVTVPGIRYVVDGCMKREMVFHPASGISGLEDVPASRAECRQREGRAGRVQSGEYHTVVSEDEFEIVEKESEVVFSTELNKRKEELTKEIQERYRTTEVKIDFEEGPEYDAEGNERAGRIKLTYSVHRLEYPVPESQRIQLHEYVLRLISYGVKEVETFDIPDKPPLEHIQEAIFLLQGLGAITDERILTPLGQEMITLPVEPRMARMIIAAREEQCVQEALKIAFLARERDMFRYHPTEEERIAGGTEEQLRKKQAEYRSTFRSDWELYLQTLNQFEAARDKRAFCDEKGLREEVLEKALGAFDQICHMLYANDNGEYITAENPNVNRRALNRAILTGFAPDHLIKQAETKRGVKYIRLDRGDGSVRLASNATVSPTLGVCLNFNRGKARDQVQIFHYAVGIHPVGAHDVFEAMPSHCKRVKGECHYNPDAQRGETGYDYSFKTRDGSYYSLGHDSISEGSQGEANEFAEWLANNTTMDPFFHQAENQLTLRQANDYYTRSQHKLSYPNLKALYLDRLGRVSSVQQAMLQYTEADFLFTLDDFYTPEQRQLIDQAYPSHITLHGIEISIDYRYQREQYGDGQRELFGFISINEEALDQLNDDMIADLHLPDDLKLSFQVYWPKEKGGTYDYHVRSSSGMTLQKIKEEIISNRNEDVWRTVAQKPPEQSIDFTSGEPLPNVDDLTVYPPFEFSNDAEGRPIYAYAGIEYTPETYYKKERCVVRYFPNKKDAEQKTETAKKVYQKKESERLIKNLRAEIEPLNTQVEALVDARLLYSRHNNYDIPPEDASQMRETYQNARTTIFYNADSTIEDIERAKQELLDLLNQFNAFETAKKSKEVEQEKVKESIREIIARVRPLIEQIELKYSSELATRVRNIEYRVNNYRLPLADLLEVLSEMQSIEYAALEEMKRIVKAEAAGRSPYDYAQATYDPKGYSGGFNPAFAGLAELKAGGGKTGTQKSAQTPKPSQPRVDSQPKAPEVMTREIRLQLEADLEYIYSLLSLIKEFGAPAKANQMQRDRDLTKLQEKMKAARGLAAEVKLMVAAGDETPSRLRGKVDTARQAAESAYKSFGSTILPGYETKWVGRYKAAWEEVPIWIQESVELQEFIDAGLATPEQVLVAAHEELSKRARSLMAGGTIEREQVIEAIINSL